MIEIVPLPGLPEIQPGVHVAPLLVEAAAAAGRPLRTGDCVVVTQKVVSKAEDRLVPLDPADPDARRRLVEAESVRILRRRGDLIISETATASSAPTPASTFPTSTRVGRPCCRWTGTAPPAAFATGFGPAAGVEVAVVISDTFGRPWRHGLVDVAIGVAGLAAVVDLRGWRTTGAGPSRSPRWRSPTRSPPPPNW